ncbi:MAG: hypothetical protein QOE70_3438 [Chthoniobacter sp.]|nr:hypothetical protein [Chthoniobacter sp.]
MPAGALAQVQPGAIGGRSCSTWLQSDLRLHYARRATWHRGDKPLPLVVSAQEAIFRLRRLHKQEQVPVVVLALEHVDFELRLALGAELHLEELALLVGDNIERVVGALTPPRQVIWTNDTEPRTHAGELIRDRFRVHIFKLGRTYWRDGLSCDLEPPWLPMIGCRAVIALELMG